MGLHVDLEYEVADGKHRDRKHRVGKNQTTLNGNGVNYFEAPSDWAAMVYRNTAEIQEISVYEHKFYQLRAH